MQMPMEVLLLEVRMSAGQVALRCSPRTTESEYLEWSLESCIFLDEEEPSLETVESED